MPIYHGGNNISDIYYGGNKIGQIYVDNNLVYESNKVIDLGNGQSFNIKSLYPDLYASLTASNFFFTTATSVSATDTVTVSVDGDTKYINLVSGIDKSYNASTGVLTFYIKVNSTKANVRAYLVTKPSKLAYLGVGQSFNVKNSYPSKYTQFTADNFLIKQIKHFNGGGNDGYAFRGSRTYAGTWRGTDTCSIVKSYDASTGALTVYMNDTGSTDISESWNRNSDCYVYLNEKV